MSYLLLLLILYELLVSVTCIGNVWPVLNHYLQLVLFFIWLQYWVPFLAIHLSLGLTTSNATLQLRVFYMGLLHMSDLLLSVRHTWHAPLLYFLTVILSSRTRLALETVIFNRLRTNLILLHSSWGRQFGCRCLSWSSSTSLHNDSGSYMLLSRRVPRVLCWITLCKRPVPLVDRLLGCICGIDIFGRTQGHLELRCTDRLVGECASAVLTTHLLFELFSILDRTFLSRWRAACTWLVLHNFIFCIRWHCIAL
jgi:hypothetical protein